MVRPPEALGAPQELAHGLRVTVLGPTQNRLTRLKKDWLKAVRAALASKRMPPGDITPALLAEAMGRGRPTVPTLGTPEQLAELADQAAKFHKDKSTANGSSIALLLELDGLRLLLAGDAFGEDLVSALGMLDPGELTAFKLPHHGSRQNVSRAVIEAAQCRHWLVSTHGGGPHYHPDAAAMARVVKYGTDSPTLYFNVPSTYNEWWKNDKWRTAYGYDAKYGTAALGLTLEFHGGKVTVQEE